MHAVSYFEKKYFRTFIYFNTLIDQFVHQNKSAYKLKFSFSLNSIFTLSDHAAPLAFITIYAHGVCLTYFSMLPLTKAK